MLFGILLVDPGLADDGRIAEKLFQLLVTRFYIFQSCKHGLLLPSPAGNDRRRLSTTRAQPIGQEGMADANSDLCDGVSFQKRRRPQLPGAVPEFQRQENLRMAPPRQESRREKWMGVTRISPPVSRYRRISS